MPGAREGRPSAKVAPEVQVHREARGKREPRSAARKRRRRGGGPREERRARAICTRHVTFALARTRPKGAILSRREVPPRSAVKFSKRLLSSRGFSPLRLRASGPSFLRSFESSLPSFFFSLFYDRPRLSSLALALFHFHTVLPEPPADAADPTIRVGNSGEMGVRKN